MDPQVALKEYKEKIDPLLEDYFQTKIKQTSQLSEFAGKITSDLADFTLRGGKRFRAALIYYAYKLFEGQNDPEIIKLSIFIELIQSFLLIHDDIMDRSDLRRGGETIHKVYENFSNEHTFGDDSHFGTTMGILVGDLAEQYALEIIAQSDFPSSTKDRLLKIVAKEIAKVCYGQVYDVLLNYNYPADYTEKDILNVYQYKTATYTFTLPLQVGAVLAGASEEELEKLNHFAIPCGIAYQIRDDILGVFGRSDETGKDVSGDISEGKKTLLVNWAQKNGNQIQNERLKQLIGKKDLTSLETEEVRQIFKETGALDFAKQFCENQVQLAQTELSYFSSKNQFAYTFLNEIADFIVVRKL
jgi:geranylgeranyl diphosphate synthase type I